MSIQSDTLALTDSFSGSLEILDKREIISLLFYFRTYPLSAAMKIFKLSEVESVAIRKWGSIEKLEAEQEKRKQQNSKLERKNEEGKRHFWDHEEIFKPLEHFMVNLELPEERVSYYFREKIDDVLGEC